MASLSRGSRCLPTSHLDLKYKLAPLLRWLLAAGTSGTQMEILAEPGWTHTTWSVQTLSHRSQTGRSGTGRSRGAALPPFKTLPSSSQPGSIMRGWEGHPMGSQSYEECPCRTFDLVLRDGATITGIKVSDTTTTPPTHTHT